MQNGRPAVVLLPCPESVFGQEGGRRRKEEGEKEMERTKRKKGEREKVRKRSRRAVGVGNETVRPI